MKLEGGRSCPGARYNTEPAGAPPPPPPHPERKNPLPYSSHEPGEYEGPLQHHRSSVGGMVLHWQESMQRARPWTGKAENKGVQKRDKKG